MTDIDQMEAGRELDALVAQQVMGLNVEWVSGVPMWVGGDELPGSPVIIGPDKFGHSVKPYSTDIAAAWELVNHLEARGYDLGRVGKEFGEGLYLGQFFHGQTYGHACPHARGKTASLAIVRAAWNCVKTCPVRLPT